MRKRPLERIDRQVAISVVSAAVIAMMVSCSNEQKEKGNAVKTTKKDENTAKQTHELALTDANFTTETSLGVVLIDFWAPWCGPCRMQGPIVEKVAAAMAGRAKVGKCDVDEAPQSAERFGVRSIPTLVVLKDNKEVERFVGVQSESQLIAALKAHLGDSRTHLR